MRKIYLVDLSEEEKTALTDWTKKGKSSVRKINRARILLLADEGRTDQAIAEALGVGASTVERTRKKFVEGGLEFALDERPRLGGQSPSWTATSMPTSRLWPVASDPPEGRKQWTMQLLADKLVELEVVA